MKSIRIFISSPGDVAIERDKARKVVEGLQKRYAGQLRLESVLWEGLTCFWPEQRLQEWLWRNMEVIFGQNASRMVCSGHE